MPFLTIATNKRNPRYHKRKIILHRKENDSFLAHHLKNSHIPTERVSAFTLKGSITLEAAIATSFFFFGALCLVCLLEIMTIQTTMKSALCAVGKEVAVEVCINPMIPTSQMERDIVEIIGQERLDRSMIVGGSEGIDCSNSKKYWNTTIMDLSVSYQIEVPVLMFRVPLISKEEVIRIKGWTGHEVKLTDDIENEMVYVTDYGIVYHKDRNCTYLELSIRAVNLDAVSDLRNQSGGIYKACELCGKSIGTQENVYITDYGDRYHKSLGCSGLKRNIYTISLTDAHGLGGCSKCVK